MQVKIRSLAELKKLAAGLQKTIGKNGAVLALTGELGAGKTTFAKFFLRAAGVKNKITSPTFVLLNRYRKAGRFYYHLDLYRLKNYKAAEALGITEAWQDGKDIFLIEWADKIRRHLPKRAIELKFAATGATETTRTIQILNLPQKMAKMISKLTKTH